jgi:hypothetical protein
LTAKPDIVYRQDGDQKGIQDAKRIVPEVTPESPGSQGARDTCHEKQ